MPSPSSAAGGGTSAADAASVSALRLSSKQVNPKRPARRRCDAIDLRPHCLTSLSDHLEPAGWVWAAMAGFQTGKLMWLTLNDNVLLMLPFEWVTTAVQTTEWEAWSSGLKSFVFVFFVFFLSLQLCGHGSSGGRSGGGTEQPLSSRTLGGSGG